MLNTHFVTMIQYDLQKELSYEDYLKLQEQS